MPEFDPKSGLTAPGWVSETVYKAGKGTLFLAKKPFILKEYFHKLAKELSR